VNLLLLDDADFVAADRVLLRDRRLTHLHEVHRAESGDSLRVGRLGGLMGEGRLLSLSRDEAQLQVSFTQAPPAKLPLTLLLALPWPPWAYRAWCC
jgi:16S rRNA U1498 N3-methylase RsmE